MTDAPMLDAAIEYLRRGWNPLPFHVDKKWPRLASWKDFQTKRTTETDLRAFWREQPNSNVGTVTGQISNLSVIDLDGPCAPGLLKARGIELPKTRVHKSPHGYHSIYTYCPEMVTASGLIVAGDEDECGCVDDDGKPKKCGADTRNDGAVLVLPPSVFDGVQYRVVRDMDPQPFPNLPEIFTTSPRKDRETGRARSLEPGEVIPEGQRQEQLTSLAGTMRRRGIGTSAIDAALQVENQERCSPPLPESEVSSIAASVGRYSPGTPQNSTAAKYAMGGWPPDKAGGSRNGSERVRDFADDEEPAPREIKTVRASDVEAQEVRFLMKDRIVDGKLNLLMGMPGDGKSTIALDIAAAMSRGGTLPDGTTASIGQTLYISAEDAIADTLKPRLVRQGADCEKVFFVDLPAMAAENWYLTLNDIGLIEAKALELEVNLIVIDPMFAFMGTTDVINNSKVRLITNNLSFMADRTGIPILAIGHPNKAQASHTMDRVSGARDIAAAARSILIAGCDQNDRTKRYFGSIKNSVGPEPPMLAYHFAEDGTLKWDGEVDGIDASDLMRSASPEKIEQGRDAREMLVELLSDSPKPGSATKAEVKRETGCSDSTVRRAASELGITRESGHIYKTTADDKAVWMWSLPPALIHDAHVEDAHVSNWGDEQLVIPNTTQTEATTTKTGQVARETVTSNLEHDPSFFAVNRDDEVETEMARQAAIAQRGTD